MLSGSSLIWIGLIAILVLGGVLLWLRRLANAREQPHSAIPIVVPLSDGQTRRERERPPGPAPDWEVHEGRTIRFHRPVNETLKLIPGRLEVIAGEDRQTEIRFVRLPGVPPEVTMGRSEGVPLRHIQFRASTVSRNHARMVFTRSGWVIVNHSQTNPVVVNGTELVPPVDQHTLSDGDTVEMGQVVFRFHAR